MPFGKNTGRSEFQGDTEEKSVRHIQPPIKAAGWEGWESVGHLLHGQRLVNTPCGYMRSGNYEAITPANYLELKAGIKSWTLQGAVIWEAVAADVQW